MKTMKTVVEDDIYSCEEILQKKDINEAKSLLVQLVPAYSDYIEGITEGLDYYAPTFGMGRSNIDFLSDIKILKRKLELFCSNNCEPTKNFGKKVSGNKVEINNNNNNNNTNTVSNCLNIEVLFNQAKEKIETDESLSEDEINEVLRKIEEIKQIHESNEPKNKKWFKLRPTMEWLGTKGLTIATTIINLITAVIKSN